MAVEKILEKIININRIHEDTNQQLDDLSKKYHHSMHITNIYDFFNVIDFLEQDENRSAQLKIKYIVNNDFLIKNYLNYIASDRLKPGVEFETIFSHALDNFNLIYDFIINGIAQLAYSEIARIYYGRVGLYYNHVRIPTSKGQFQKIPLDQSCIAYIAPFIQTIWDKYNDKFFKKCSRGPKLMFKLYIMFQEYFTEDMFLTLLDRLKVYEDKFMIKYLLEGSRVQLTEKQQNRVLSIYTILQFTSQQH